MSARFRDMPTNPTYLWYNVLVQPCAPKGRVAGNPPGTASPARRRISDGPASLCVKESPVLLTLLALCQPDATQPSGVSGEFITNATASPCNNRARHSKRYY